ncbi:U-scoloptoxin(16)-Er12a-like isoform X1 [Periplaneta americana]|uniref:U-scoloptoxin(16)-Er12a-like isoform X1 n=1 Tax=Periplaneta americana TaxID=6978 RepID=UPI0037E88BCF
MKLRVRLVFVLLLSFLLTMTDARPKRRPNCPSACGNCSAHNVGDEWQGRSVSATSCGSIKCKRFREMTMNIGGVGCPSESFAPGVKNCYMKPGIVGAIYPACCPRPFCEKD